MPPATEVSELMPQVVAFDEPLPAGFDARALLGGKGAGLAEMCALGLPVPPGFVITTEVCRRYFDSGWPAELDAELSRHLDRLATKTGRRFGDAETPLLVSVRSGAPMSMPGMMDSLLNVGMTPAIRDRIAEETDSPEFAADTWQRFNDTFSASTEDRATGVPNDPYSQLRTAIETVFQSWHSDRARVFRGREQIEEHVGTAATVQAMVFGNLDDQSGTGVAFTRDPATGDARAYGDYLPRAQGEDVVAGTHATGDLETLRAALPEVHATLLEALRTLEHHYRDICDVEFTVSAGQLYILQTRIGRRSPLAAVRAAVAMAGDPDFPLSRAEAVARVDAQTLRAVTEASQVDPDAAILASGLAVSPGVGVGVLCCDPDRASELASRGIGVVLARSETSPADIHGMVGAAAIVTTLGGVASHAAVVARSWAIPAVTGVATVEVTATGLRVGDSFVAEGELVTVDGGRGTIHLGDQRQAGAADVPEAATLRAWARELGVEPGTVADDTQAQGRDADVTLLEVARTVQLKGLCTPERAAQALATAEDRIAQLIADHDQHFRDSPRGVMLSPDGRSWLDDALERERATLDASALTDTYDAFMQLNHQFKELVSDWQINSADGSDEAAQRRLVDAVGQIDVGVQPLVADIANHLPRLAPYGSRFASALDALRDGDTSMLASPLKDSYHTVWFEFHEELIGAIGRDRATEEGAS